MSSTMLQTRRLSFRELSQADLDFVAEMLAHPEVMRYYPKCLNRDEAAAWIERQRDRYIAHGIGLWLVSDRLTGEPIGQVGPTPNEIDGVPFVDLAYLIHRPYWRQSFATEAAVGVRDYTFDVLGQPRVYCLIRPENLASQGVAAKVGLTREDGRIVKRAGLDHWVYSGARSEFSNA